MSKWIPAGESLPPAGVDVLVFCQDDRQHWVEVASYSERRNCFMAESGLSIPSVTHWQPLPEPPV